MIADQQRGRIWGHVLFWVVHWLVLSLYGGLYDRDFGTTTLFNLSGLPLIIPISYVFVYGILPLYFQRRWILFGVLTVVAFVGMVLLKRVYLQYVQFPWLYTGSDYTFMFFNWYQMMGYLVQMAVTVGLMAGLKYYRDWRRTKDRMETLSAEKRAAELSFLKAQVHPHFLFNTLNSIYYEVLRKSDVAPDLIIRLSDLLRFTLYECKDPWIPIRKEVELIKNYVALEQHRYGERLSVTFSVEGETERLIPPLICFSLVENAFKHGTSQNKDRSHIQIQMVVTEDRLRMEVNNPVAMALQADVLGASKGIGMRNITQQLGLIFGQDYVLKTEVRGERFLSILEMPLS